MKENAKHKLNPLGSVLGEVGAAQARLVTLQQGEVDRLGRVSINFARGWESGCNLEESNVYKRLEKTRGYLCTDGRIEKERF